MTQTRAEKIDDIINRLDAIAMPEEAAHKCKAALRQYLEQLGEYLAKCDKKSEDYL